MNFCIGLDKLEPHNANNIGLVMTQTRPRKKIVYKTFVHPTPGVL